MRLFGIHIHITTDRQLSELEKAKKKSADELAELGKANAMKAYAEGRDRQRTIDKSILATVLADNHELKVKLGQKIHV